MSPLYERLSLAVSGSPEILAIAALRRAGQPAPNLFFAAVHALLMEETSHPLASFYPDLAPGAETSGDPYPAFRRFCLERRERIAEIVSVRGVQTNVVRRSALLLPAFARALRGAGGMPVFLVEVGASAGLNLFWDKYGYDYGGGHRWGDPASPVQLATACQGRFPPMLPDAPVNVAHRVGLDLEPVDLGNREAVAWLEALVWPERRDEAELLRRAMELARNDPPRMLRGDALELLPEVLDEAPPDCALCVFHSHTLNQFPPEARERFDRMMRRYGERRDLNVISLEARRGRENSELELLTWRGGVRNWERVATCDSHGYRIKWLGDSR